jgi:hypothetical protein
VYESSGTEKDTLLNVEFSKLFTIETFVMVPPLFGISKGKK